MKTQLIVTVTQTGENPATPRYLEDELRSLVKDGFANISGRVTVRHVVEDAEPAGDTLEALVREYGNAPVMGKGRNRLDVMNDIRALMPVPGSQVSPSMARPPIPVEEAVATLNATVAKGQDTDITVGQKRLHGLLVDTHRAGQMTGRLLGKEGREKAAAFADNVVALITHA